MSLLTRLNKNRGELWAANWRTLSVSTGKCIET